MMDLLYKGTREGETLWNKVVNSCLTSIPLGQAVRNRAWYLKDWMERTATQIQRPNIMSIACGPCEEVRLFVKHCPKLEANFYLVDQDPEALSYACEQMELNRENKRASFHFLQDSVKAFLKSDFRVHEYPKMHFIYTAGLYDYLEKEIASALTSALYSLLEEGGILLIGNFVKDHPFGYFIEYASDWFLIHRTSQDMLSLVPSSVLEEHRWIEKEQSGVNLFLCIKKTS